MVRDAHHALLAAQIATAAELHALRQALAGEAVDEAAALDAAIAGWQRALADPRLGEWLATDPGDAARSAVGGSRCDETPGAATGAAEPMIGALVDARYRVMRSLGAGGMGEVWQAEDTTTGEHVALKRVRAGLSGDEALAYFRHEVRAAARVVHDNVVRLYDAVVEGAAVYMVMELLDGEPLRRRMGRPMAAEVMRTLLSDACAGVAAAHAVGVIHRDLKPENLVVVRGSEGGVRLKVVDFGLAVVDARDAVGNPTGLSMLAGTPRYMAPEQVERAATSPATDVYALALVACEMASGALPYAGQAPVAMMMRKLREPFAVPSAAPPGLVPVLERALARDPAERYPDAGAFGAALAGADWTPPTGTVLVTDPATLASLAVPEPGGAILSRPIDAETLWQTAAPSALAAFDPDALAALPEPARRYLAHAIAPGAPAPAAVRFAIDGEIKLGAKWVAFRGQQVIAPARGFVFAGTARMGLLRIKGHDTLVDGSGAMAWKLFGVIPVARGAGADVTRSAAGRFNGEALFTPHRLLPAAGAAWHSAGDDAARFVITAFGETTQGTLTVDGEGRPRAVRFDRWGDFGGQGFCVQPFGVVLDGEAEAGGLRLPASLRAGWGEPEALGGGEFFRARLSAFEVRGGVSG